MKNCCKLFCNSIYFISFMFPFIFFKNDLCLVRTFFDHRNVHWIKSMCENLTPFFSIENCTDENDPFWNDEPILILNSIAVKHKIFIVKKYNFHLKIFISASCQCTNNFFAPTACITYHFPFLFFFFLEHIRWVLYDSISRLIILSYTE